MIGESAEGLIVSGARMLATLAPYADELYVFPSPSRTQQIDAPRFAFAFTVPVATPGLQFICRDSLDTGGSQADYPLASVMKKWMQWRCSTMSWCLGSGFF